LAGGVSVAAECRADAVKISSGHCRTDTTPADEYPDFRGATLHRFTNLFCVVRIIVRNGAVVSAEVDQLMPLLLQFLDHSLIERVTTMIRANSDSHNLIYRITGFHMIYMSILIIL